MPCPHRRIGRRRQGVLVVFGFLNFIWLNRVLITMIKPRPLKPVAPAAYGQQIAALVIFGLLFIPLCFKLAKIKRWE